VKLLLAATVAATFGLALAGCLSGTHAPAAAPARQGLAQRLAANVPPLQWDGDAGVGWWESFVNATPKRDAFLPNNAVAVARIADSVRALGLETTVLDYPAATPLVGSPSLPAAAGPLDIQVVVGLKRGTQEPDHAIAVGGHFDTQSATVYGAYDNGAGTAMTYNVCKELSKVPLKKSLLCLFFDGEELGVEGSSAYVRHPPAGSPRIDAYLGFDMTGMNWPGYPAWKAYTWTGEEFAPEVFPLVNATIHDVLGWPLSGAEAFPFNDRNSDEAVFAGAHIPTIRFAGGRTAGAYDQYHMPDDTVAHVYQVVGGRQHFVQGFGAIVQEAYTLAAMLDQTSLDELRHDSS